MPRPHSITSLAFAVLVMVGAVAPTFAQCTCNDINDLTNRLHEVDAAILEYQNQIKGMETEEQETGKPLMTTPGNYKLGSGGLQDRVQRIINMVSDTTAHTSHSETEPGDCNIINRAATSCMQASTDAHENIHRAACLKARSTLVEELLRQNGDWKQTMRLADVAKEEIAGYTAEKAFLLSQMSSLRNCKAPQLSGVVLMRFYSKIATSKSSKTDTRTVKATTTETSDDTTLEYGSLIVDDDRKKLTISLEETFTSKTETSGSAFCGKGGLAGADQGEWRSFSNHSSQDRTVTGAFTGEPQSFGFSKQNGKHHVEIQLPSVKSTGTESAG